MADLPPDIVFETVYVIEGTYAPDAAESRVPVRGEHLGRILELRDRGVVIDAGGFADMSSSLMLVRAESEEAALDLFRDDAYLRAGVWVELRCRPLIRVVRQSELLGSPSAE
jgi:uncharacterized protein YciI